MTVGNFVPQSGFDIVVASDEAVATEIIARVPGSDSDIVVSFAFGIKSDADGSKL